MENKNEELVSLYDYLGKPAGPELGASVAKCAIANKEKIGNKPVENPKFVGKVLTYRKEFLNNYFYTAKSHY
jgi:hypothetical protein